MAPVPIPVYRPAPRRPQEPVRPWWRSVGGWTDAVLWGVIASLGALVLVGIGRMAVDNRRIAAETVEVRREAAYMRTVWAWAQDTSFKAPAPDSADRPLPSSDRAKPMWVISRMLVDRTEREREVMKRHGIEHHMSPLDWFTPRYQANARAYPAVGKYLEGHLAAITELRKTSAAWREARVAARARESGIPTREILDLFPLEFADVTPEDARQAEVLLEFHRHYVRIDPRVSRGEGTLLAFDRPDDIRRGRELMARANDAMAAAARARAAKFETERAALSPTSPRRSRVYYVVLQ